MGILRYCLDRRVLAALGVVALATVLLAPRAIGAVVPVLLLAACPVSMVVMAVAMGRNIARPVSSSPVESMRTELAELAERQRRLEAELAAAETKGTR